MVDKEQIKILLYNQEKLQQKLQKISKTVKALQDICDHEWKNIGHDSHKDHYECNICSKTDCW